MFYNHYTTSSRIYNIKHALQQQKPSFGFGMETRSAIVRQCNGCASLTQARFVKLMLVSPTSAGEEERCSIIEVISS